MRRILTLCLLALSVAFAADFFVPAGKEAPVYPTDPHERHVYMPYQQGELEYMLSVGDIRVHLHLNRSFTYMQNVSPFPFWAYAGHSGVCQVSLLWLPHHLEEPVLMAWLILHEYGHCVDRLKLGYDHNGLTHGNNYHPDYPAPERFANAYANLWIRRHQEMHGQGTYPVYWLDFEDGISVIDTSAMPDPREVCTTWLTCDEASAPYSMPPEVH